MKVRLRRPLCGRGRKQEPSRTLSGYLNALSMNMWNVTNLVLARWLRGRGCAHAGLSGPAPQPGGGAPRLLPLPAPAHARLAVGPRLLTSHAGRGGLKPTNGYNSKSYFSLRLIPESSRFQFYIPVPLTVLNIIKNIG